MRVEIGSRSPPDELEPKLAMTKLLVEIPEDVTDALRLPPAEQERELRKELALALHQRGVLALGKPRRARPLQFTGS